MKGGRVYHEVLTKEEKLEKAVEALKDHEKLTAHLSDREREGFYKLLARRLGLEYGALHLASWAMDQKTKAHLKRVTS